MDVEGVASRTGGAVGGIDCHVHVIDATRFPFADVVSYRPTAGERAPVDALLAQLDAAAIDHAVLVQPSWYGNDLSALRDAARRRPAGFALVGALPLEADLDVMRQLRDEGVSAVRLNPLHGDAAVSSDPRLHRWLADLASADLALEIVCPAKAWQELGPRLMDTSLRVIVDHFGLPDVDAGWFQPGWRHLLSQGASGRAAI